MPKAATRLPERITLLWGSDHLIINDPGWIAKIAQEVESIRESAQRIGIRLAEPTSRREERLDADLRKHGLGAIYVDPKAPPKLIGYSVPKQHATVAAEALKAFLGLELPTALNFTDSWSRNGCRMSAVHTAFELCRSNYITNELEVCWVFNGYQLYATHHIGMAFHRPSSTERWGLIERRLLNGKWVRWSYDGPSSPPTGRRWSGSRRYFALSDSGIVRIDSDEFDLSRVYEDRDFEGDAEDPNPEPEVTL